MSGIVPLADLISAAAEQRSAWLFDAIHREGAQATDLAAIQRQLLETFGQDAAAPDLSAAGMALMAGRQVSLPGAPRAAYQLIYRPNAGPGSAGRSEDVLALFLIRDEGQYLAFDSLGRPTPLQPDRLYQDDISRSADDEMAAMAWSDGPLLQVAIVETAEEAARLRPVLGAP